MEFSKKMLILHCMVTICLVIATMVGTFLHCDVTALAALAGSSFVVDGTWGGFYLLKSKNENRAKYAQKFVRLFAKEYGVDAAIRLAEIVLKD